MEFYNEAIKNRFLDEIENEGTRVTVSYIFLASKGAESILEKDLYNFSIEEIEEIMKNLPRQTINSVRGNYTNIKKYISWSIKNGYRDNNLNPLDGYGRDWYSKFIDRTNKIHYSDDELYDLLEEFDNAQDQAMVQLWFEGVGGKAFSELKNLTYYDVDWTNNILTLKDEKGIERELTVSDQCMRYLLNAYNQSTYTIINSDGEEGREFELFESNYIFRNVKAKVTKEKEVSNGVIYSRLAGIKEKFGLDVFSYNAIRQSGQIFMAAQIFLRDGNVGDRKHWKEIGDRFNLSKIINNGITYYNSRLMKNYITSKNLKDLYDIDVDIKINEVKRRKS